MCSHFLFTWVTFQTHKQLKHTTTILKDYVTQNIAEMEMQLPCYAKIYANCCEVL